MPHHKHSKILSKNIMYIVNDYLKPDKSGYKNIYSACMGHLIYIKLIYNSYSFLNKYSTLLSVLRYKKNNNVFSYKDYQTLSRLSKEKYQYIDEEY